MPYRRATYGSILIFMSNIEAAGKGSRMTTIPSPTSKPTTPNYGVDAPSVMRNLSLAGGLQPFILHIGFARHHPPERPHAP